MRVVIINKSDDTGGAAMVSRRLLDALREAGVDARMIVCERLTDSPYIATAAPDWKIKKSFIAERLKILATLRGDRTNLFKIDTAADGLPLHRHPWVLQADVICLNWVNQGMLSLKGIRRLAALGKPIVWTMHDVWNMTGLCHHTGACDRFTETCGVCPLLTPHSTPDDLSHRVWERKKALYDDISIHFVAVSNWLRRRAMTSTLMRHAEISVIPNAFPIPKEVTDAERGPRNPGEVTLIFGAARLDDPIKGLPTLIETTRLLAAEKGGVAYRLITYGRLKDSTALDGIAIPHTHLGLLSGERAIREAYLKADIVLSTSHYETLPGTIVEGQAYGCIPVTLDRGGQSDIIDHLSTGYLARYDADTHLAAMNMADGIRWAATRLNADTRRAMRHSVITRFEAANIAARYIVLFDKLLSQKKSIIN